MAKAVRRVVGSYDRRHCAWCGGRFTPLAESSFYCGDLCSLAMSAACGEAPVKWLVGAPIATPAALDYAMQRRRRPERAAYREPAGPIPAEAPTLR